ncbi:hypothetical protein [Pseudoalteromonas phenolica]|uniref:hypothetical protein n=1 Tax=Pseudoalteromonas phenolica TaxID=161398 RepID=UPI00110B961F|nr:hypothetical protein [Pseudoalteromonas phenolica]TMO53092.1 hypothetical protein CWC21_21190 [Pseudoalteromonas phenolica]
MTELENIGKLAATTSELLNAIRGGEIANMKAEHVQVLQDFETAYNKAIADFGTEKTQKLSEFNNQKTSVLNDLANRANAVIAKVESQLSTYVDAQSHVRLTKNQALRPNDANTFPANWSAGYVTRATKIERVSTGVDAADRSALAQEFLSAINSNCKHFAGGFDIWELEIEPHRNDGTTYSYAMYQHYKKPCAVTVAAIVKHISGVVPDSHWCHGLQANEPAKVCGGTFRVGTSRNGYSNCHPFVRGVGQDEKTIIQVALPAVVTGEVDISQGAWGQFPYIGDQAFD